MKVRLEKKNYTSPLGNRIKSLRKYSPKPNQHPTLLHKMPLTNSKFNKHYNVHNYKNTLLLRKVKISFHFVR